MAKRRGKVSETDLFARTDSTPSEQHDSKAAGQQSSEKVKNTYYLTADTDYRLDLARAELRRITGEKVSKSDIIEAALKGALDDFEQTGRGSYLAILLSK